MTALKRRTGLRSSATIVVKWATPSSAAFRLPVRVSVRATTTSKLMARVMIGIPIPLPPSAMKTLTEMLKRAVGPPAVVDGKPGRMVENAMLGSVYRSVED